VRERRSLVCLRELSLATNHLEDTGLDSEFCYRYRERNVPNPREMLALRDTPVDLRKWRLISFGRSPSAKLKALAERGFVVLELTKSFVRRHADSARAK
jgi:hypothetical protein